MLPRLILLVLVLGGGVVAWRFVRSIMMAQGKRLGSGELKRLGTLGRDMPLLAEALGTRAQIHSNSEDEALLTDVDAAVRAMGDQAAARLRLSSAISDLEKASSDARLAELEVEISTTDDPDRREVMERRLAQAERQQKTAADMRARKEGLKAAQEKLVLELKDLHLALLEQGAAEAQGPQTQLLRERINDASEHMRLKAAAMDEVQGLLKAQND